MEIIYGVNPVKEAIKAGRRRIFEIMVSREQYEDIASMVRGMPINALSRKELDRIVGERNHQGVIAKVSPYRYAALKDLMDLTVVVLLDSVEDPQNLGSIIRTANALAAAGIVIPEDRSASITPAVVKASAGATEHAHIARVTNLRQAAKELKKYGFWLVGLEPAANDPLEETPRFDKLALVLGGEDTGIRPVMEKELDLLCHIPMQGAFNSLNVAQSAAIALYELITRRK
jgi:23S rRNA (guanosine2251-2'-O)-methyltransferase